MDFDLSNLFTTILDGLILAILTGLFGAIVRAIKKVRDNNDWKNSEIQNKLVSELQEDRLDLITSPRYIPTMGQKNGPHNNENIITSVPLKFGTVKNL